MASTHTPRMLPPASVHVGLWALDPGTVFLNHGSFGAMPRAVRAAQDALRDQLEADPVRFFVEDLWTMLDDARRAIAPLLGCAWESLAFVNNATVGVATALDNIPTNPGDELIVNDHEYLACRNNAARWAARRGVRIVSVPMPFPIASPQQAADAILGACTQRTRWCLLSAVTSASGLILPYERIIADLRARGVETILDAAHLPGFAPMDIDRAAAAFTTGNLHKWVCTPKGCAFFHARSDWHERLADQGGVRPIILSNNASSPRPGRPQFRTEFDYVGTDDPTAWLATPAAVERMRSLLPGGWPALMEHNKGLALRARDLLCHRLGTSPPAPDSMIGCLAAIALPQHAPDREAALARRPSRYHDALQDRLLEHWKIQVPIHSVSGQRVVRISAQAYNDIAQYAYLADALAHELAAEGRSEAAGPVTPRPQPTRTH